MKPLIDRNDDPAIYRPYFASPTTQAEYWGSSPSTLHGPISRAGHSPDMLSVDWDGLPDRVVSHDRPTRPLVPGVTYWPLLIFEKSSNYYYATMLFSPLSFAYMQPVCFSNGYIGWYMVKDYILDVQDARPTLDIWARAFNVDSFLGIAPLGNFGFIKRYYPPAITGIPSRHFVEGAEYEWAEGEEKPETVELVVPRVWPPQPTP